MRGGGAWLLAGAALALVAAPPVLAFVSADLGTRAVAADVVPDADAYLAVTGGSCTVDADAGGTCAFTVTNLGTEPSAVAVALADDPEARVDSHGLSDAGVLAVGAATTLTANILPRGVAPDPYTVLWDVSRDSAERPGYAMTIAWGA